ncbi:hypothetical protein AT269_09425 [Bacillus cereus]|nr:hypothetical protein AT269_09425 [Bacillus cereus]
MVSIICCTIRQNLMEDIFNNYERQIWDEKELIIILNKDDLEQTVWEIRASFSENVYIYKIPECVTLGECLNFGIQKAKCKYIAKFDDDDYYSPNYISSSIKYLITSGADLVGKRTTFMYFEEEQALTIHKPGKEKQFVSQGLKGATLLFKREIGLNISFPTLNLGEDTYFIRKCILNNMKVYSSDRYNYVCIRKADENHHTWRIDNQNLLKKSLFVCKTDNYKQIVFKEYD